MDTLRAQVMFLQRDIIREKIGNSLLTSVYVGTNFRLERKVSAYLTNFLRDPGSMPVLNIVRIESSKKIKRYAQ